MTKFLFLLSFVFVHAAQSALTITDLWGVETHWWFKAVVEMTAPADVNGRWEMLLEFDVPVQLKDQLWNCIVKERFDDGKTFLVENRYNNNILAGQKYQMELQGSYTVTKPSSGSATWVYPAPAAITAAPTTARATSSVATTAEPTTAAPTTAGPSMAASKTTALTMLSGTCAGTLMKISDWGTGYNARIYVTAETDINSWTAHLQFPHPTTRLDIWSANVISCNSDGTLYYIEPVSWNRQINAEQQLELGFVIYFESAYGNNNNACLTFYPNSQPVTGAPTAAGPSTAGPSTAGPSTAGPSTASPSTAGPLTAGPSTAGPSTTGHTTAGPSTAGPTTAAPPIGSTVPTPSTKYDYDDALYKALWFYEAQRSGPLPADNQVSWRGDSSLKDGQDVGKNLTGGWHDAGDYVKFGFPMASSATMLLTGMEFLKEGYVAAGQLSWARRQVKWPLDYFLKCFDEENDVFYAQVGDGDIDHAWMGRPEEMEGIIQRPTYGVGVGLGSGGADICGQTAAALAAGSVAFKEVDPPYSATLLDKAKALYALGERLPGLYQTVVSDAGQFYSSDEWKDDMAHAAAWISYALGSSHSDYNSYLTDAASLLNQISGSEPPWALDWTDKRVLVRLLMFELTGQQSYSTLTADFLQSWMPGGSVPYTPAGLAYRLQWGSLRYAANAAFTSLLYAKQQNNNQTYIDWAKTQIHYMLGDNGRSLVVGFGVNPPQRPHHKAAACELPQRDPVCDWSDFSAGTPSPQILYGALVGGPDSSDTYVDDRNDYVKNEVACDYNAGFTGALAGLKYYAVIGKV